MSVSVGSRGELIKQYRDGYDVLVASLDGITDAEWLSREGLDEWNALEIVHHLGDSEMAAAVALRMLVADQNPVVPGYSERAWVDSLHTGKRPIEPSMAAFRFARESTFAILDNLTEEEWNLQGSYANEEPMSPSIWLEWYGPHAHDHADQIRRARAGKF